MTGGRRVRTLLAVTALLAAWPLGAAVPAARAATPDLTLVTDTTYLVQPDKARIQVVMDVTAASHKPETKTSMYYYDHALLLVQAGAASPKVSGLKGAKVKIAKRTSKATTLRVDFGKRLYGGASASFRLSFVLPDSGATGSQVRVSASLVTIPVWAFASVSTPGSRVAVEFPAGYTVAVESGGFDITDTTPAGGTRLATGPLADPLAFFAFVSGQQTPQWAESPLSVPVEDGSVELLMRSWADDPVWGGRIGKVLAKALPVLRQDIGFTWPHTDPVVVQEAVSRVGGGHAGRFDPSGGIIEIAYWAGDEATIHEAVHGWLNGRVLADRWAVEGFASWYAGRVTVQLGGKASAAPTISEAQQALAFPLNDWPAEAGSDPAVEAYGFTASAVLASAIAKRAGDDALRRVWVAAADRVAAYQPPVIATTPGAVTETTVGSPDWRSLLDLLADDTGQDFTDLWRTWVVRPAEAHLLDARLAARRQYAQTLALANGWTLPRSIRDALRAWRFDGAETLMAGARTVLAKRVALEQQAVAAGQVLPDTVRTLFQTGSLAAAALEADREAAAITAITTAAAARTDEHDLLSSVGMIGEQPDADLAAAARALSDGHADDATASAARAYRAWTGAWAEGRRRLVFLLALIASLAILAPAWWARAGRPLAIRRRAAA